MQSTQSKEGNNYVKINMMPPMNNENDRVDKCSFLCHAGEGI